MPHKVKEKKKHMQWFNLIQEMQRIKFTVACNIRGHNHYVICTVLVYYSLRSLNPRLPASVVECSCPPGQNHHNFLLIK